MALNDGPYKLIYGVNLTDSTNDLSIAEDQDDDGTYESEEAVSISAGDYWGHNDDSFDSTLSGLYKALEDALNNETTFGNTYVIEAQTPANNSITNSGIRLRASSSTHPFQINWGLTTIPPQALGFVEGKTGTTASTSGQIDSPFTARTYWHPNGKPNGGRAAEYDGDEMIEIYTSSDDEENSFQVQHGDERQMRELLFRWNPGALIREGKADDADGADLAEVETGDVGAALYHLWTWARDKKEIIVVHGSGRSDLQVDAHDWERGTLRGKKVRSTFSSLIDERVEEAGDFTNVRIPYTILGGNVSLN